MTPQELKNSILQLAIQGKLVEQRPEEGTAEELYRQIQQDKQKLIKEGKIKKEKLLPEITEEEKPFDIPDSWKWCRIGNIFSLQAGKNITSDDIYPESSIDHPYQCYGGNGVRGYVESYNRNGQYAIIGRQGALCGNINIAKGMFYATEHAVVVDHFEITDVLWDAFFLTALNLNQYATATAQPGLAVANIILVPIPLPPLAEQQRIVAKIEELLPLIDRYEKAWSRLEEFNKQFPGDMQKSILQMAIQGKLVEQRPEEGTGEELYQQIQQEKQKLIKEGKVKKEKTLPEITEEEKPFDIPENWKWVHFSDVMDVRDGTHDTPKYVTDGISLVTSKNLIDGRIDFETTKLISYTDAKAINLRSAVDDGDILFAMIGTIGNPVLVKKDREFCIKNMALFKNFSHELLYMPYVLRILQKEQSNMKKIASGGVQSFVSLRFLREYLLPLPPILEQKRIVDKLEALLPICKRLER